MRVTKCRKITRGELLALMPDLQEQIKTAEAKTGAHAMMVFECLDLCSSQIGQRSVVMVGPGLTYESIAMARDQRLGDVPSQFKYPVAWCRTLLYWSERTEMEAGEHDEQDADGNVYLDLDDAEGQL